MRRLSEHVALRSDAQAILLHPDGDLTAGDIGARVAWSRSDNLLACGQSFQIRGEDDLGLILALLAADGWVSELVLPPHEAGLGKSVSAQVVSPSAKEQGGVSRKVESAGDWLPCDTDWLLTTSGTTGQPQWIRHTLGSLTQAIKTNPAAGAALRWGLLYDPRRFAGLQVVLQAILGRSSLVVPADRNDVMQTVVEFRCHGVNALSATPSCWRKLLIAGAASQLDLQLVTLGGEIADAAVLEALRGAFPQARITHIYASTEAGVGFSVRDGREGFPATWVDDPRRGAQLRVDPDGQLLVRPPRSAAAYADGRPLTDHEGWVPTGDLVERRGERYFFLGRIEGTINVGGEKVHPKTIEDVALAVPGVAFAHARGKSSAILGQVVELLVEPTGTVDRATFGEQVMARCRAELRRPQWPVQVRVVDDLRLSPAGKVDRAGQPSEQNGLG